MRLIDADALKHELKTKRDYLDTSTAVGRGEYIASNKAITILDEQPTVDAVQVKHGRWMKCTNHYWEGRYKCSKCGYDTDVDTLIGKPIYNFCPYCGAKMDGEREEDASD